MERQARRQKENKGRRKEEDEEDDERRNAVRTKESGPPSRIAKHDSHLPT